MLQQRLGETDAAYEARKRRVKLVRQGGLANQLGGGGGAGGGGTPPGYPPNLLTNGDMDSATLDPWNFDNAPFMSYTQGALRLYASSTQYARHQTAYSEAGIVENDVVNFAVKVSGWVSNEIGIKLASNQATEYFPGFAGDGEYTMQIIKVAGSLEFGYPQLHSGSAESDMQIEFVKMWV